MLYLSSSPTNEQAPTHGNAVAQMAEIALLRCYLYQKKKGGGMKIFLVEKKTNNLCGLYAITYRSAELLFWMSSCLVASWPP